MANSIHIHFFFLPINKIDGLYQKKKMVNTIYYDLIVINSNK